MSIIPDCYNKPTLSHAKVTIDGEVWWVVGTTYSQSRGEEYFLSPKPGGQPHRVCYKPHDCTKPCKFKVHGKLHSYE